MRGTHVHVELSSQAGSYQAPQSDAPSVVREDSHSGGYPSDAPAVGDFTGIASGSAHITSEMDMPCLHATPPCMVAQRGFTVTIEVH